MAENHPRLHVVPGDLVVPMDTSITSVVEYRMNKIRNVFAKSEQI